MSADARLSAALMLQLKVDEGLRLRPYDDVAGKVSIGFGRNLTDVGISLDEANILLANDVNHVLTQLPQRWPTFTTLDPIRQQVIANMAYNLGLAGLMQFTKMLAACAAGDFATAAADMLESLWARQVGARAHRLATMMETGKLA